MNPALPAAMILAQEASGPLSAFLHSLFLPMRKSPNSPDAYPWSKKPGLFYAIAGIPWQIAFWFTMRIKTHGLEHAEQPGGALIAISHLSHLDPVVVSSLVKRKISWVSRKEFYQYRLMRMFLQHGGAFQVDRQGSALPTIREGLKRLRTGEMVGIFPEGEVVSGADSMFYGAKIKRGVCLLSAHSGCPIIPVVVLGSNRLTELGPWLPAKRGKLWVYVGKPIAAQPNGKGRAGRASFAMEVERSFRDLYAEACDHFGLPRNIAPSSAKADHVLDKLPPQKEETAA